MGAEGQAPEPQQPQAGSQGGPTPAGEAQTQPYDEAFVSKLRAEAAKHRVEAREAQNKLDALNKASMSEQERKDAEHKAAEARAQAAEQKVREVSLKYAISNAAAKANAKYPDALARLIDTSGIEYDRDGEPKGIDEMIAKARKEYPDLFRPPAGSADAGQGGRGAAPQGEADMNAVLRKAFGR